MLILFGLFHAKRLRASFVLMAGIVSLTWAQRLSPDAPPTLDPRQAVTLAWVHQLPLVAFGLGEKATKRLEADAAKHDAEVYGPTVLLGSSGEGWFPYPGAELTVGKR